MAGKAQALSSEASSLLTETWLAEPSLVLGFRKKKRLGNGYESKRKPLGTTCFGLCLSFCQ